MNRIKKAVLGGLAVATLVIVPTTALAAKAGHHGKAQLYRGAVAAATCSTPLTITLKSGDQMSFKLKAKTRYFVNHQRVASEPCFSVGERVRVIARQHKNGLWVARAVRARQKAS